MQITNVNSPLIYLTIIIASVEIPFPRDVIILFQEKDAYCQRQIITEINGDNVNSVVYLMVAVPHGSPILDPFNTLEEPTQQYR